jgi:hypothetical protein
MEVPAAARGGRKRSLDEVREPEFVAQEDGAYDIVAMPKLYKHNYRADKDLVHTDDLSYLDTMFARDTAMVERVMIHEQGRRAHPEAPSRGGEEDAGDARSMQC